MATAFDNLPIEIARSELKTHYKGLGAWASDAVRGSKRLTPDMLSIVTPNWARNREDSHHE